MNNKTLRLTILYCFLALLLSALSCGKDEKIADPVIPEDTLPKDPAQYETPFAEVPNTPDITMYEINQSCSRLHWFRLERSKGRLRSCKIRPNSAIYSCTKSST